MTVNPNAPRKTWIKVTTAYRRQIVTGWILTSLPPFLAFLAVTVPTLVFVVTVPNSTQEVTEAVKCLSVIMMGIIDYFAGRSLTESFFWHLDKLYMSAKDHARMLERHQKWCDQVDAAQRDGRKEPPYPY